MPTSRLALILLAPLALAGCGSGSDKEQNDQRTAAGEILPGSASDAMLPFDTVRSQPPLAPKEAAKPGTKGASANEAEPSASEVPTESAAGTTDAPAEPADPAQ